MYHHTAFAVKNMEATDYFYSQVMGFRLAAAVKRKSPGGGWTKHIFYDTGDGSLIAFWDLRGLEGVQIEADAWRSSISTGLGLPDFVNHLAFECADEAEYNTCRQRWLDHGYHVTEVHHEWIYSAYTFDPDKNMVEWTYRLRDLTQDDADEARAILLDDTAPTIADHGGAVLRSDKPKRRFGDPKPLDAA